MARVFQWLVFVILTGIIISCNEEPSTSTIRLNDMTVDSIQISDPNSFANFNDVRVTHLNWSTGINFDQKTMNCIAIWSIERLGDGDELILDTRDLVIHKVWLNGEEESEFRMGESNQMYGTPLIILIEVVTDMFNTASSSLPYAAGIHCLDPVQLAGKEKPFLFSHSQAILARTCIPCQAGSGVRFTYEATVTVLPGLMAVMS